MHNYTDCLHVLARSKVKRAGFHVPLSALDKLSADNWSILNFFVAKKKFPFLDFSFSHMKPSVRPQA